MECYISYKPSKSHNDIYHNLFFTFHDYVKDNSHYKIIPKGNIFLNNNTDFSNIEEYINSSIMVQGDLSIRERPLISSNKGYLGIPKLIIEILGPTNSYNDILLKFNLYEKYGVDEFWIISPLDDFVNIYNIVNNKFKLIHSCKVKEKFTSTSFPGVIFDLKEVR